MAGPKFFQTGMGHTFYEGTMPRIAKALEQLAAALEKSNEPRVELALASTAGESPRKLLARADDIFALLRDRIPAEQEAFYVVAIDVRNGMIGEPTMIALGHVHGVEVHPREVFRDAVRKAAAGIIVAHNHPSGDPTPSSEDVELTKRLRAAGDIVGIPLIDHLVLTPDRYRSIAEWMGTEF